MSNRNIGFKVETIDELYERWKAIPQNAGKSKEDFFQARRDMKSRRGAPPQTSVVLNYDYSVIPKPSPEERFTAAKAIVQEIIIQDN